MEVLEYILEHFWTMAIIEVVCILAIVIIPLTYWINERKNEKTIGDFCEFLRDEGEGWLVILTITLIPYLNIGIVLFVYITFFLIYIRAWIMNRSIYKKFINKISNIKLRK